MKNIMLRKTMPLVAATWVDAFRRVRNRIALVAAAICAAAAPLSSFAEAKEATLKTTYSGSTLTGFQVLVKLSASNDAYGFSYTEAGGASHNIWFTSADGATVYPHEIDKWDTSGDSFVWVRLPELKKGTTFKMHWSDSAGDVQSASGNVNVWDGYVGVWHMNETGTTAEPDKTGHGLNAAPINNSSASTSINTDTNGGQIGNGRAVSQATMFKVSGHASYISEAKTFTIGGWVKRTGSGDYPRIFVGNPNNSTRTKWEVYGWSATELIARGGDKDFTRNVDLSTSAGWKYLTVVYTGTTATIYDNGAPVGNAGAINNAVQDSYFTIGAVSGANNRSFVGTFDEVRMYNGALSADRIAADYATMNDPTTFLTLVPAAQGATLTHRWSFTSDYTDSVGGTANGSLWGGSNPSFANGQVTFPGTGWGSGSADLGGPGLTGGGDTTIEIWAKNNALSAAEIMFEYGAPKNNYGGYGGSKQCFAYYWSDENAQGNDIFIVKKGNYTSHSSKSGIMPATVGTMYHFSFTFKADGNGGTVVNFARRNATTGALEASGTHTVPNWTLSHLESQTPSFSLNISKEPQYKPAANAYNGSNSRYSDSNATYDEVRIWNGVLSDDQLAANASMGPDVYASGLTEGFELAAGTKFNVPKEGYTASGVVTLGAGSKLRFDSAKFQGQTVTFSAAGYSVPSGSILDYVELTDPFNFTVSLSGNTITVAPVSVASAAVDYFVEWVQPSSPNLYVDTGVRGQVGVKAEVQFIHRSNGDYPVLLGSWGGNNKRFNLVMHLGEQGRWEYGNQMNNLGAFPWYGALTTVNVEVPANGAMSCTWKNTEGGTMNHTMNATGTYGLLDTAATLYLFASHYKDASSDQANQNHRGRLYYCKLWEGDTGAWTLARNFRPCVKDGVAGLYDYVTGEVHYPVSSVAGCVLVAGPVAYDRIATWNGGATPTAAELGTAANWTCTDKSGASLQSAVPDRTTLAVFPAGIGSVTLPSGYAAPWGAVRAEGSEAHPATQYGSRADDRSNVVVPFYEYTSLGEGSLGGLVRVNGGTSAVNFQRKQVRHDGWFYVNAAQAGTWAMTLYVDDYYAFYIDDVQVLSYHSWQGGIAGTATCEVSEGWHRFTSIIGDTGGGWGTSTTFGNDKVPFTFVVNGTTYSLTDDVTFPKGSGASTITLSADADWSALGKIALLGGVTIDLNGHSLVVDDILADDYLGTVVTNSAAKKSVLYFLGDPLESKAYADGIIKETDVKIILAKDGDQVATWTGTVSGDPANANNWEDLAGEPVVPTAAYTVKVAGSSVNLQCPAGTDIACKAFEIGNCTFAADCDWRGLSIKPSIIGTANLNGHVLKLSNLSAVSGATFSGGDGSFVEFVVNESATIANLYEHTYIENVGNLAFSGSARIRLRKKDGNGTLTVTRLELGNQLNGDMVQTNGTVNLGNKVNAIGENSGKTSTYTMTGGSINVAGGSEFIVGSYGTGVFNQSGGSVTLNEWFSLGRHGGNGTYTMTGGSLTANHTSNGPWIGADNGTGTLTIGSGATATFKGGLDNGRNNGANSKGYLNLNGGTLTVRGGWGFNVGRDGTGTLVQNGGTLTANEGGTSGNANNVWRIAWGTGGTGSYTLNDGTAIAKSNFYIGDGGTATYVQNGGTMIAGNGATLAVGSVAKTTFTLSGGVFYTKHIQKGSGTLNGVTFDGGTIVATNVTNGANFITGLNNVKYGPGGLTLDTAGYDVTMATASGANVLASAGSTFTKTGSGTLTVAAVPPVGNMAVSSGTLALSATCDNTSMLAHRWSFASDLTDSVTGTAGTMSGSGATYADGVVKLPGGNKGTCYIDLGANKLPSDSVTIETWFTLRSQVDWTRVFLIGGSSGSFTVFNSRRGTDGNACNFDSLNGTQIVNTSGKVLAKDTPYYVAITFTPDGNGGVIEKQYVKKVGDSGFIWNNTVTKANWSVTANAAQGYFWLGHSTGNDKDTNIDFDEVRVWSGALDDTEIALSVEKGADATAADIAEIVAANAVPAQRTLELASGTTLAVGSGNTLTQPAVNANGTLASGSLVVTKQFNVTPGQSMTVASGATLDLTGADIVVTGEIPAGGCVIATAPSGGIVAARPRKLTGGYWLYLKSGEARIGKRKGVMVIAH